MATTRASTRPLWQRGLEAALLLAAGTGLAWLAVDVVRACAVSGAWWILPVGALAGLLLADFASGLLHWFCDRFLAATTPGIGPLLIAPFREHHERPHGIVAHDLLELHGNSAIPVLAALLALPLLPSWTLLQATALCFLCASLATNQCHKWAHDPAPPRAARWLQSRHLILPPAVHGRHHAGGFDRSYCMTTGWLNPLLDRIGFFPALERRLGRRPADG